MTAAIMQPLLAMALDREIMAPSPMSNNQSRHGRGKHGGSISNNKKTRQRGYSIIAERDSTVTRALIKLLKRSVEQDLEQGENSEKLIADSEGWFNCEKVLDDLNSFDLGLSELQNIVQSPSAKSRFTMKSISSSVIESESPSNYLIRLDTSSTPTTNALTNTSSISLQLLSAATADLPDLVVYETSYANYPLILASGGIKKAGGQAHLAFSSIFVSSDGTEARTSSSTSKDDADVSIYISLKSTLESHPEIKWYKNGNGGILSEGDGEGIISKSVWKKVIARRADIGVLFENGTVKKEVPVGLRGKGVKGKKGGRGKGNTWNKEMKERSEDEAESSEG
ncbi:putative trna 2 -phosphotransferase 1 protein [Botrytis fragariae]|uniref:Putative trna 2 -phosphotransferase 1 protein n=1 Tax=Botrytis fragariae TaxID=1964551 RepID=A0A8H6ELV3_9HELO|nr:putative trna 2 -phosphotransferase 1 protein [Botrytis fragariae]KAF5877066.1 putative trna 2 -phosphotransferase 1 protein [Botrytis fragariae]